MQEERLELAYVVKIASREWRTFSWELSPFVTT